MGWYEEEGYVEVEQGWGEDSALDNAFFDESSLGGCVAEVYSRFSVFCIFDNPFLDVVVGRGVECVVYQDAVVYSVEGSSEVEGNDDCSFGGFLLVEAVGDVVCEFGEGSDSGVVVAESVL